MTLAEIMMVVALIGVIGMGMLNFDFETATDKERRDRFVTRVAWIIRHMKTASVSGRVSTTGNCTGFALQIGTNAMTGTMASFTETWAVATTCGTDADSNLPAPMLWDAQDYRIVAITWLSSSNGTEFRISESGDYGWNVNTIANSVAVLVDGSNLSAYPLTCGDPVTCTQYAAFSKTVKLKLNLAYKQPVNSRNKVTSKDLFLDLRTGNVEIKEPTTP